MKRNFLYFLALVSVLSGCCSEKDRQIRDTLKELDDVISRQEEIESAKDSYIELIKGRYSEAMSPDEKYTIFDELYNEYYNYNIDSAIFYARSKLNIAFDAAEQDLVDDAILDIADRYVMSGMYLAAHDIISEISADRLDVLLVPRYYHIWHSLYTGLEDGCDDPVQKTEYRKLKQQYREQLFSLLGKDDISRLYVMADIYVDEGRADELLDTLNAKFNEDIPIHDKAVLSYIYANISDSYGHDDDATLYFAKSAIFDLMTPVHEYKSLYELASKLYDAGDIKRAYRYISRSINDAITANALINIQSINRSLPIISRSYHTQMLHNRRQLSVLSGILGIMAVLLIGAVIVTLKEQRKARQAGKRTSEINEELKAINRKMEEYILLLKESNNIKEIYIGRYIDLCSEYIGRMERYRSMLNRTARTEGFEAVRNALKSSEFIDKELNEFYEQFDATFLQLFPDFIKDLNALLQPDKRIELKTRDGIMTTELRIFALIRLGITDSVKIAEFLRRSVSTVYNYRVKMRNAALNSREDFEKQIMGIGKLS
ncbi:MAG: hypothetical protein IAB91_01180 [Bacteroidetes bacterium]|uniref:DUF6377 domain-containing protein n=1 Tax=Candidatus Cryptobacteroides faecigallinarum TaxID=2840763 RepID=A0A9D9IKJ4_9BACT|nr:hypothetical protein [Candidatus Cryptobacteroides faecigallinarum]